MPLNSIIGKINWLVSQVNTYIEIGVNIVRGILNDWLNKIDKYACPGDCWDTDPVKYISLTNINNIGTVSLPSETIAGWLSDGMDFLGTNPDEICEDLNGQKVFIKKILTLSKLDKALAESAKLAGVEFYQDDIDNNFIPDIDVAKGECIAIGGHICTEGDISLIAEYSDSNISDLVSYGDWSGGEEDSVAMTSGGSVLSVPWPPVRANISKLINIPPDLPPFDFSLPAYPSGKYRCCWSSIH